MTSKASLASSAPHLTGPAQYQPVFEEWAKTHASSIYWSVLRALMQRKP